MGDKAGRKAPPSTHRLPAPGLAAFAATSRWQLLSWARDAVIHAHRKKVPRLCHAGSCRRFSIIRARCGRSQESSALSQARSKKNAGRIWGAKTGRWKFSYDGLSNPDSESSTMRSEQGQLITLLTLLSLQNINNTSTLCQTPDSIVPFPGLPTVYLSLALSTHCRSRARLVIPQRIAARHHVLHPAKLAGHMTAKILRLTTVHGLTEYPVQRRSLGPRHRSRPAWSKS